VANSAIGICRGSESVGQDSYNDSKNLKVLEVQEGKWASGKFRQAAALARCLRP